MEFTIASATWIKEEDEQVLAILRRADRWLTAQELSGLTGLPPSRVERTLKNLQQQMQLTRNREKCREFLEE